MCLPGRPPLLVAELPEDLYVKWALVSRAGKWVDCSVRSNGCYGIYTRRVKERAACLGG
jgi:hypothetical protein